VGNAPRITRIGQRAAPRAKEAPHDPTHDALGRSPHAQPNRKRHGGVQWGALHGADSRVGRVAAPPAVNAVDQVLVHGCLDVARFYILGGEARDGKSSFHVAR
jgi:hypothetical protein